MMDAVLFQARVSRETYQRIQRIAFEMGKAELKRVPLNKVLEVALDALERERLQKQPQKA
jgi:hypothetical protein